MSIPKNWLWRSDAKMPGRSVVFDVDGVISNANGRQHFVAGESRDWKGFFAACGDDELIQETARLMSLLSSEVTVILLTARPISVQQTTVDWFDRQGLDWDLLIMRASGDYTASLAFKQQAVRRLKVMGFELVLAFEDDRKNLEMFQNENVPCMYVHSGYYAQRDAEEASQ